jgi:hypothetical protein
MTASGVFCAPRAHKSYGGLPMLGIAHLQPLVALLAGVLILLVPRILNYVIAIYLIVTGLIGLDLIPRLFH